MYKGENLENILGMDFLLILMWDLLPLKRLKHAKVNLASVKIKHTALPKPSKASFTRQYSLKGGHREMTEKIVELLGIIEKGRSHLFQQSSMAHT